MFIQCQDGALVNLKLVGQIYINPNHDETEFSVVAETGTANYESSMVWKVISKHRSRGAAQSAINLLFKTMREDIGIGFESPSH